MMLLTQSLLSVLLFCLRVWVSLATPFVFADFIDVNVATGEDLMAAFDKVDKDHSNGFIFHLGKGDFTMSSVLFNHEGVGIYGAGEDQTKITLICDDGPDPAGSIISYTDFVMKQVNLVSKCNTTDNLFVVQKSISLMDSTFDITATKGGLFKGQNVNIYAKNINVIGPVATVFDTESTEYHPFQLFNVNITKALCDDSSSFIKAAYANLEVDQLVVDVANHGRGCKVIELDQTPAAKITGFRATFEIIPESHDFCIYADADRVELEGFRLVGCNIHNIADRDGLMMHLTDGSIQGTGINLVQAYNSAMFIKNVQMKGLGGVNLYCVEGVLHSLVYIENSDFASCNTYANDADVILVNTKMTDGLDCNIAGNGRCVTRNY